MTKRNSRINCGDLTIFGIPGIALAIFLAISGLAGATSVTNVALNAEVTLNGGNFLTVYNGYPGGWTDVLPSTIVDGVFFPQSTQWNLGPLWWDSTTGQNPYIEINLNGIYNIESFVLQTDDNDAYELYYRDLTTNTWQLAWNVPNYNVYDGVNLYGMQTRPNPYDNTAKYLLTTPITTNALKFKGNMNNGDKMFSISEIQAYGQLAVIPVNIDIKLGSDPNSINLGSNGNVPVAILGSPTFDVTTVNPYSISLAGAAVNLKGKAQTPQSSYEDVNGDGFMDLIVHVSTKSLVVSEGDTEAVLTGMTYDGIPISGKDSVRIVPPV